MTTFAQSIRLQLENYVHELKTDNPSWTATDILATFLENFQAQQPGVVVRDGAVVKSGSVDTDETKCDARVWSGWNADKQKMVGGWGSRCTKNKVCGGGFCGLHQKAADVTCEPCQFWEDGDELPKNAKVGGKKGLHYGLWADDAPIMSADGKTIAVVWKSPELVLKIIEMMKAGATYHRYTGQGKKGRTTPPRAPSKKKSSTKKNKNQNQKKAFDYWRKENDKVVRKAIRDMCDLTKKFPCMTLTLLAEHNLDVTAAYATYEDIDAETWGTFCTESPVSEGGVKEGADNLGNFTGKLTHGMILGLTGKLCHLIWARLSETDRRPWQDAKNAADSAAGDDATPKQAKKAKKAKKKKAEKAKKAPPPVEEEDSDSDEEDEAHEYELADGTTVFVDSEWNAYNEDCIPLGVVNPETKTLTPKDG